LIEQEDLQPVEMIRPSRNCPERALGAGAVNAEAAMRSERSDEH
jgi:hypothetical protein